MVKKTVRKATKAKSHKAKKIDAHHWLTFGLFTVAGVIGLAGFAATNINNTYASNSDPIPGTTFTVAEVNDCAANIKMAMKADAKNGDGVANWYSALKAKCPLIVKTTTPWGTVEDQMSSLLTDTYKAKLQNVVVAQPDPTVGNPTIDTYKAAKKILDEKRITNDGVSYINLSEMEATSAALDKLQSNPAISADLDTLVPVGDRTYSNLKTFTNEVVGLLSESTQFGKMADARYAWKGMIANMSVSQKANLKTALISAVNDMVTQGKFVTIGDVQNNGTLIGSAIPDDVTVDSLLTDPLQTSNIGQMVIFRSLIGTEL